MRLASILPLALLGLVAGPLGAAGPTFTVSTPGDALDAVPDGQCETAVGNHTCTLRAAVMEANATTDATIVIPAGTYSLTRMPAGADDVTTGDLNITSSVTIQGAGAGATILEAATLGDRVFDVALSATLKISGVTIQNATRHATDTAVGGAIHVDTLGKLEMSDSRITNCTVSDPVIAFGGALHLEGSSTATLTRTVIDTCSTGATMFGGGGAICSYGAALTLDGCTITGCTANGQPGGAILDAANSPVTRVLASTLSGNTGTNGGAIANVVGSVIVVNSTISGNKAKVDGGGVFAGTAGAVHLYNVTVTDNRSDSDANGSGAGGGVYSESSAAFSFQNSLLVFNYDTNMTLSFVNGDCSGTLTSNGHNVVVSLFKSCAINGTYSQDDPFLFAELGDNGGPTLTHEFAGGGSAVDHGDPLGCTDDLAVILTTDQRGVHRPIGAACDIGAVELEPKGDANGDGHVDVGDVFYLINYLFAGGPRPLGRANVNGDQAIGVGDVFYLINHLFAGGAQPL